MHSLRSRRTLPRYRSFVISALLHFTGMVGYSSSQMFSQDSNILGTYESLPVFCDEKYRSKYIYPDFGKMALTRAKHAPQTGLSEEVDWGPNDGQQLLLPGEGFEFPPGSEFMSSEDKTQEFLTHDEDMSTEFIDNRGELRSFGRNSVPFVLNVTRTSKVYDLEDNADSRRRFLRKDRGEEIGRRRKRIRVTFGGEPSRLRKKLRSVPRYRKPNRKFDLGEVTSVKPWIIANIFRSTFDGRRDASMDPQIDLHRAVWSENNCKFFRRIVGGHTLESPEELPYMVFVDTGCGGAIVGDMWVLTAAHCIDNADAKYVHAGSLDLLGGCQYNVVQSFPHPRFSNETLEYDIALLKTSPSFIYSPAIKPIHLSMNKVRRKTCGVVSGWGAETYKGSPKYQLKMTMIPVVGRKRCRMFGIKKGQFCAGYRDASSDACQGDSGGPFVVNGILVGIVSFGYKCAMPNAPGVYVDVSYHRQWIRSVAKI